MAKTKRQTQREQEQDNCYLVRAWALERDIALDTSIKSLHPCKVWTEDRGMIDKTHRHTGPHLEVAWYRSDVEDPDDPMVCVPLSRLAAALRSEYPQLAEQAAADAESTREYYRQLRAERKERLAASVLEAGGTED